MPHAEENELRKKLREIQIEHEDLDEVISRLSSDPKVDQLLLGRMKKRKLHLKDLIAKLETKLIPDMHA